MNVLLFHNVSLFIFFPNRIIYNTNRNGKCSGYHTQFKLKREALLNIFWSALGNVLSITYVTKFQKSKIIQRSVICT